MPRGWAWLREGLQLWRRNPALLTFATFGYLLSIIVISLVPLLGQLAERAPIDIQYLVEEPGEWHLRITRKPLGVSV